jgi:hypothetical protein
MASKKALTNLESKKPAMKQQGGDKELPFLDPSSRFEAVLRSLKQPPRTNFKLITNNDLHYSAFYAICIMN